MTRVNIIGWIAKRLKALVGIVEDTDTATHAIAKGKYVIWKGSLRKTSAAISVGDALSSSNLSEVSEGIGNELNSNTTPQTVTGCAMATGWGNPTCDCRKIGKLVFVKIYGDNTSGSTMTNIATGLPACASGNNQILAHYGAGGSSVSPAFGYIDANGNMILRNIAGNTIPYGDSVFGNLVYLTN